MNIHSYSFFFAFSIQAQEKTVLILDSKNIFTEEHKWNVRSVALRNDCTIVEKYVCPMEDNITWIASEKSEFIEDAATISNKNNKQIYN